MIAALLSLLLTSQVAADAMPVGMVLQVQGKVSIERAGAADGKVGPGALIYIDNKLHVAAGGKLILVCFADGHKEQIAAGGQVTVGKSGCQPAAAVKRIRSVKPASKGFRAGLQFIKQNGRGAGYIFRDLEAQGVNTNGAPQVTPISGEAVLTSRPSFSWPPVLGAAGYTVELVAGASARRVWIVETHQTTLAYPKDRKPLPQDRRRLYSWSVQARMPEGMKSPAKIESRLIVVSKADVERLAEVGVMAKSDNIADLTLAAAMYDASRDYSKALVVLEKLSKLDPTQPAYHLARARYYQMAGRSKDAAEARKQAEPK